MSRITREQEKRDFEQIQDYNMDFANPLSLPHGVAKPGYDYRWVRREVKGQYDYRVEQLLQEGWVLIPLERAPSNINYDPLGVNPLAKQYFCKKDVILMERPNHLTEKAREALNRKNNDKIRSLRGVTRDVANSSRTHSINSF